MKKYLLIFFFISILSQSFAQGVNAEKVDYEKVAFGSLPSYINENSTEDDFFNYFGPLQRNPAGNFEFSFNGTDYLVSFDDDGRIKKIAFFQPNENASSLVNYLMGQTTLKTILIKNDYVEFKMFFTKVNIIVDAIPNTGIFITQEMDEQDS